MIARLSTRPPDRDEERIREFISRDYARLVAALTVLCGARAIAEEVVQEALAKAWEREMRDEHIDSIAAWVTTVSFNLAKTKRRRALAEIRARRRLERGTDDDARRGREIELAERHLDLVRGIRSLPRRQREVVALHYFVDMDIRHISRSLGLSEGGVKALLFRARRGLAASLGESEEWIAEGDSNDAQR